MAGRQHQNKKNSWNLLSLEEKLDKIKKNFGQYPLPVVRVEDISSVYLIVRDQIKAHHNFLITKETKKGKETFFLYRAIDKKDCDLPYELANRKFRRHPTISAWIIEYSHNAFRLYNEEYSEQLSKIKLQKRQIC